MGNDDLTVEDAIAELQAIEAELARRKALESGTHFMKFVRATFKEFEESWHHQVVGDFLDEFALGNITRGMIIMPPRHTKSEFVSRRLPPYIFGRNPDARIIASSYGSTLAGMMSRDVQRIMQGEEYKTIFPETIIGEGEAKQTSDYFEIVGRNGYYRGAGIGGGIIGMGASYAIIDDPIKSAEEADSKTYRDKVWEWFTAQVYPRLEKPGSILITMTRWHTDDLIGRLLDRMHTDPDSDQYDILHLPAIMEAA